MLGKPKTLSPTHFFKFKPIRLLNAKINTPTKFKSTNSVDSDQSASFEKLTDLDLHCSKGETNSYSAGAWIKHLICATRLHIALIVLNNGKMLHVTTGYSIQHLFPIKIHIRIICRLGV